MLEQIRDLTPEAARGWFYFGLPITGEHNQNLGVSASIENGHELATSLERVAVDARSSGIVSASPGEVVAGAILQSLFRYMLARTCESDEQNAGSRPLDVARAEMGEADVSGCLRTFSEQYPPNQGDADHLRGTYEILLLQLGFENRALSGVVGLFGPDIRAKNPAIKDFIRVLDSGLTTGEGAGGGQMGLLDYLREPLKHAPDDLFGQVQFVLNEWADILPPAMRTALLRSRDLLEEERRMRGGDPDPCRR